MPQPQTLTTTIAGILGEPMPTTCGRCGAPHNQWRTADNRRVPEFCSRCMEHIASIGKQIDEQRKADPVVINVRPAKTRDQIANELRMPPRYRGATLESLALFGDEVARNRQRRVIQLALRFLDGWETRGTSDTFPRIVILTGPTGTAKTHIAWAIAQHIALEEGASVRVAAMPDVVLDIRESWRKGDDGDSERRRLVKYRDVDLLVLDEVSTHALRGDIAPELYAIIAHREQWDRPTILTTNETPETLGSVIGPALISRTERWAGVWSCNWDDARPLLRTGALKGSESSAA